MTLDFLMAFSRASRASSRFEGSSSMTKPFFAALNVIVGDLRNPEASTFVKGLPSHGWVS